MKYSSTKERRSHCISVHKFPSNFRYDVEKFSKKISKSHVAGEQKSDSKGKKAAGSEHCGTDRVVFQNRRGGHCWHRRGGQVRKPTKDVTLHMSELEEALPSVEVLPNELLPMED